MIQPTMQQFLSEEQTFIHERIGFQGNGNVGRFAE